MSNKITKKLDKKIDKLSFQWKVKLPADVIDEEVQKQLKEIQSKAKIDGFRAGNAPLDVIEKKYGEDVLFRATNTMINRSINEILDEENYKLAIAPEVSLKSEIKKGEDVEFSVKIVIKPTIPDIKYDKIEFDVCELELSDEDKEKELENFRSKMAKMKLSKEVKAVENGDMVDIDFTGRTADDNVEFSGGAAKGYKLEIGSHSFIDGFEDQIIGHKKGEEFDVNVKFPDDYPAENLKGKNAIFAIKLNDVYIKELPELNDEFAKTLGFDNMSKIESLLFDNLKNVYESNLKNMIKGEVFEKIIEKNPFDMPESVIEKEIEERFLEEKERAKKENKEFDEKSEKKLMTEGITKSYASFYLTDGIAEQNNISVSKEEIEQVVSQDAIRNGMNVKDALENLKKDEKIQNYVAFTIKEAKVFEFVYDKIKKNVKKLDKKAFEKFLEDKREEMTKRAETKKKK